MRLIKTGIVATNPTVGAFKTNTDKLIQSTRYLGRQNCTVVVFPEQSIAGYPPEDLVQWNRFIDQQWEQLRRFAIGCMGVKTIFVVGLSVRYNGHLYNCAAVVSDGRILGVVPKEKLPTYGVFYEGRNYSSWPAGVVVEVNDVPFGDMIFEFDFGTMGVEVCEDIWSPDGPMRRRAYSGAEFIVNISASPFRSGVLDTRRELVATRASDNLVTVAYVNQYGGNDSLVFDGGGFINQCGKSVLEMERWKETFATGIIDLDAVVKKRTENTTWRNDCQLFLQNNKPSVKYSYLSSMTDGVPCLVVDKEKLLPSVYQTSFIPVKKETIDKQDEYFEDLIQAMKTGLAGYVEKTGAFKKIGICLSGGKDSVLSLIISWLYANDKFIGLDGKNKKKAIKDFIHCFSMPTNFNSPETKEISKVICGELGVTFKEVSIKKAFDREILELQLMLGADIKIPKLTKQNIQARLRAMKLWNWCNSVSGLFIQTGNMSEKAVGYTTIGGDSSGGYSLIGNLPKTVVIALLHYLENKYKFEGLSLLMKTKASAELDDNQEDEKDLMPFEVLDACLILFAGEKLMPVEIYKTLRSRWTDAELRDMRGDYQPEMLKEWVLKFIKLFMNSVFKWVQMPQSVHLGNLDLDREAALRFPVVKSFEWLELGELERIEVIKR